MFTWLLRLLGIAAHEVTCLLCKRKVASESVAVAADWLHTLAGWECNECISRVLRRKGPGEQYLRRTLGDVGYDQVLREAEGQDEATRVEGQRKREVRAAVLRLARRADDE